MSGVFLHVVNMSISASFVAAAVLLLRLLLKKAPKWITVLLWGIVAVRLVCPITFQSALSLIPSAETISPGVIEGETPHITSGFSTFNSLLNPIIDDAFSAEPAASANPLQTWIPIFTVVWIVGIAALLVSAAISYLRVRRKIGTAVLLRDNIYQSENVSSPFVLGLVRPKIYLPFSLNEEESASVIAHEQTHIRRRDHLWKPLGFLLLSVYWFNPIMWISYVILCRDIELACDEKVVGELTPAERADYSQALLSCSVKRRMISACPLAFGEVSVKSRVRSVLNYKKPAFWVILIAIIASIAAAVCLLTNPVKTSDPDDRMQSLREKFPMYFDQAQGMGLEIIIWEGEDHSYLCGLVPGMNMDSWHDDVEKVKSNPATIAEMRDILASYYPDITKKDITVTSPEVSTRFSGMAIDGKYLDSMSELFWTLITQIPAYSPVIDTAEFDIDGDGRNEECSICYGPTTGIFTFAIYAKDNGVVEYYNMFSAPVLDLSFESAEDGNTYLIGKDRDTVNRMELKVTDGNIEILTDVRNVTYWGDQGVDAISSTTPIIKSVYKATPGDEVSEKIDREEYVVTQSHYQTDNGMWVVGDNTYAYRLEITGRMPNAEKNTTYIVLSNSENITFDQAMRASGLSSNTNDYFRSELAVLVGYRIFS